MTVGRSLALAGAIFAASPAGAAFAPPENQPFRQVVTEMRDDGAGAMRFELERVITFARDSDGWIARVTFGAVEPGLTPDDGPMAMFRRAMAAFAGRTVVYRLDARGSIRTIDEEDALWTRFVDAVAAIGGDDAARAASAGAIAAALRDLPGDRRRAILSSPIAPVVAAAGEDDIAIPSPRPVEVPSQTAVGEPIALKGRETRQRTETSIRISTEVSGAFDAGVAGKGRMTVTRLREVSIATGLVRNSREETVTELDSGGTTPRQSVVATTTLALMVF